MRHAREVLLREVERHEEKDSAKTEAERMEHNWGGKKTLKDKNYKTDNTEYSADIKMNTMMEKQCRRYPQLYVQGEVCKCPHFL